MVANEAQDGIACPLELRQAKAIEREHPGIAKRARVVDQLVGRNPKDPQEEIGFVIVREIRQRWPLGSRGCLDALHGSLEYGVCILCDGLPPSGNRSGRSLYLRLKYSEELETPAYIAGSLRHCQCRRPELPSEVPAFTFG